MKKIFGIIYLFFALLIPTLASAQCGDCQTKYELGKGPGEIFHGENIKGYIDSHLSDGGNENIPVTISMSNNSEVYLTCQSSYNGYIPMKNASKCMTANQYIEVTLSWKPGYPAIISGTWVPGHYEIIGWRLMEM